MRALLAIAVIAALTSANPASGSSPEGPDRSGRDWEVTVVTTPGPDEGSTQGVLDADPHGLVPKAPYVQRYSLDTDHFEVWLCGSVSHNMSQVIAQLEAANLDYFQALSGGRYTPAFSAGGSIPGDASCIAEFLDGTYSPVGRSTLHRGEGGRRPGQ